VRPKGLGESPNDPIGKRTRELPGCGAGRQPTAPPRAATVQQRLPSLSKSAYSHCPRAPTKGSAAVEKNARVMGSLGSVTRSSSCSVSGYGNVSACPEGVGLAFLMTMTDLSRRYRQLQKRYCFRMCVISVQDWPNDNVILTLPSRKNVLDDAKIGTEKVRRNSTTITQGRTKPTGKQSTFEHPPTRRTGKL
jgi:hypothetical protein